MTKNISGLRPKKITFLSSKLKQTRLKLGAK